MIDRLLMRQWQSMLMEYACVIMSIGPAPVDPHLGLLSAVEALLLSDGLIAEWHAEGLSLSSQMVLSFCCQFLGLDTGSLLDLLLALLDLAPGGEDDVPGVDVGHEVLPVIGLLGLVVEARHCPLVHALLDLLQDDWQFLLQFRPLHLQLLPVVPQHHTSLLVLNVLGAQFKSDRHSLQLPVVELPSRIVVVPGVNLNPQVSLLEGFVEGSGGLDDLLLLALEGDGDDDHLHVGYSWRQYESLVVPVVHRHDADRTSGQSPTRLPHQLLLLLLILELNTEHLREVLTQVVRSCSLDGPAVLGNPGFHGGGLQPSWELLGLCLDALADGDGEEFLVDTGVEVQVVKHFDLCLLEGGVGGVSLLPQELPGADEGRGVFELPTDDVGPLVELEGQVAVALDPVGVGGVHDGFGSGTDGDGLGQIAAS